MTVSRIPGRYRLAREAFRAGDLKLALLLLTRIINRNPSHFESRVSRGFIFYKLNKLLEAIADFRHALQLNPACAKTNFFLGLVLYERQKYIEALRYLERAIDFSRQESQQAVGSTNWVGILNEAESRAHAYPYLEALACRAFTYLNLSEYEKAIEDLEKVFEISPNPYYHEAQQVFEAKRQQIRFRLGSLEKQMFSLEHRQEQVPAEMKAQLAAFDKEIAALNRSLSEADADSSAPLISRLAAIAVQKRAIVTQARQEKENIEAQIVAAQGQLQAAKSELEALARWLAALTEIFSIYSR